ncbi:2744_t:CDS:2 [Diversispora eburnea]|uniref:2744_t:CDS:1 n=1 Tax=Diversispora eburnea TaxID=1213867 RepID=A0A9N8V3M3_9GLOM|nr:2744_t:CDS:2 [Diversispora eburnea]
MDTVYSIFPSENVPTNNKLMQSVTPPVTATSSFFDSTKQLDMYSLNPQPTLQENTASTLYSSQYNFTENFLKPCPSNGFKTEYYDNNLIFIPEELDTKKESKFATTNNYLYPLTPTSPKFVPNVLPIVTSDSIIDLSQQADYYYEQGQYFLHSVKPQNPFLAFSCFLKAANLGLTRAKHQVAYCLQHGLGVDKDEKKAVKIYLELVELNPPSSASFCQLGICFQMGIGVEVDESRAVNYYEQAVHLGTDAMFNLAYCLRYGLGTTIDHCRAFNLYIQLAELGDPQGMKFVGNCKSAGIGTNKDEMEALKWYHRSSKNNYYWGGKMKYALSLIDGTVIIPPNYDEAFRLIKEVCENFPSCPGPGKMLLGQFYHFGVGCQQNLQKALYWYERALQSYFMSISFVQECKSLIGDIKIHQDLTQY